MSPPTTSFASLSTLDEDPQETADWLQSLDSLTRQVGPERARFILSQLELHAQETGVAHDVLPYSPYRNTIPVGKQPPYPGDLDLEERITSIIRWNALAMVVRANKAYGELGGHIASYASAAEIFEVGFNHFFRGPESGAADLVYFQPHSSPGVYARAFLEGRLSEDNLAHDPEVRALVSHMSAHDIDSLRRGGHDFRKLHAAFKAAQETKGQPTVILAKTKKGYGMGGAGESRMTSHQAKKLDVAALLAFRDKFSLPLTNAQVEALHFYRPAEDSHERQYLLDRRAALGGFLPARARAAPALQAPPLAHYAEFALNADGKDMSTTVAAVRLFSNLLKDKTIGPRIAPIVADEARTFGMANLFRQVGIYSPVGQLYEPEDAGSMLYYKEAKDGQLLEEGITEAGAISSWAAAATSYSVHGKPMLPFYIYYSMFGFQRIGDLIWAAADQRARGFLIGATAGKTTLGGEGLQHQDGSSHLIASTVPNCRAYDPAYAYEMAVIVDYGMRRMLEENMDEFFYITAMNEPYAQPSMPAGAEADIVKGLHRLGARNEAAQARLIGAGAILPEVVAAGALLKGDWGVETEIFSATSFVELAREAQEIERANLFATNGAMQESHVATLLAGAAPVIAATDYVRALPQMIAPYVKGRFIALGTDGFGRSDTRTALRDFFEVDRFYVALAALGALAESGVLERGIVAKAIAKYGLAIKQAPSWRL